jgi:hypothetical protein
MIVLYFLMKLLLGSRLITSSQDVPALTVNWEPFVTAPAYSTGQERHLAATHLVHDEKAEDVDAHAEEVGGEEADGRQDVDGRVNERRKAGEVRVGALGLRLGLGGILGFNVMKSFGQLFIFLNI